MKSNADRELWLPTGDAARLLGISAATLKRWANPTSSTHCLQPEIHFRRGRFPNSPMRWRVDLIAQVLDERSALAAPTPTGSPVPVEVTA